MMNKGTKAFSILKEKCPRCQEGAFFKYKFTFNPSKITQIHENCPSCDLKYMMEPSFFYGAMYVNYGITVGLSMLTFLIAKLLINLTLLQCFAAIIIALIISAPINLRLSRLIWINMFVSHDPSFSSKKQ